jgi:cardiolipin synthase (CMP-forming)
MSSTMYNIPNMLCYFRVLVIPVMIALFYFDGPTAAWINTVLFSLAGLSDFLDGRIARATNQTTLLGKFLDSSTDKMLVGAALMLVVAFGRLDGLWITAAIIIFLREILIAGIREFMALYNVIVPISKLGKWKATIQMVALGFIFAGPYGDGLIPHAFDIGKFLFFIATIITVVSGWDYMKKGFETMKALDNTKTS